MSTDYATAEEALALLSSSRDDLAAAWSDLREAMAVGFVPSRGDQVAWNALVYSQVEMELDWLVFVVREDPEATFDGQPLDQVLDEIRRRQVIGDFAGDARILSGGVLGEPVSLTFLGISILIALATLGAVFTVYRLTELAQHREQSARAREYAKLQRECITATGQPCPGAEELFLPPKPPPEPLPGWAKGVIAAAAAAGLVLVAVQVAGALRPRLTSATAGGRLCGA